VLERRRTTREHARRTNPEQREEPSFGGGALHIARICRRRARTLGASSRDYRPEHHAHALLLARTNAPECLGVVKFAPPTLVIETPQTSAASAAVASFALHRTTKAKPSLSRVETDSNHPWV
jgi:hypothetical protein